MQNSALKLILYWRDPFRIWKWTWLNFNLAWMSNHMLSNVWDKITYPFLKFNVQPFTLGKGLVMSSHFIMGVVIYPRIKVFQMGNPHLGVPMFLSVVQISKYNLWVSNTRFVIMGVNSSHLDEMNAISQTIFLNAFSYMNSFVFWFEYHWNLLLWVQLIISERWFR